MKKILIVDDEALSRKRIRTFLERENASAGGNPRYEIKDARDGFEALELIPAFQPHVILLDIEMPELSGFDLLRHLEQRDFQVIFQTAYDQFAVRAFEVNACDYVLKPFTDERLRESLARALARSGDATPGKELRALDRYLADEKSYLDKFVIKIGAKNRVITEDQVFYLYSEEHITRIFLADIDYAYDYSLNHLQERLDPAKFLRIHRNCIVKVDAITQFTGGPEATVTLKNGATVKASREGGRALRAFMQ